MPHPEHRKWPYLLRGMVIDRPNQDRSCRHHLHPHATRFSLPCRDHGLGNAPGPVLAAVEHRAMVRHWSEDHGEGMSNFAWKHWRMPCAAMDDRKFSIRIKTVSSPAHAIPEFCSMRRCRSPWTAADAGWTTLGQSLGPMAFLPSIIERLWRSLKYECVYLNAFETGAEARTGVGNWISFYNHERPHSALGGRTSVEAHLGPGLKAAA